MSLKYFTITCFCVNCGAKNFYQAKKGSKMKEMECWKCHNVGTLSKKPTTDTNQPRRE